jgi:hypothetical protein
LNLRNLPARLDDETLAMVERVASCPLPKSSSCDEVHFLRCLRSMSLLPRRAEDELTGELRTALYRRHLGHFSRDAMSYLAETSTRQCQWFPTPRECLEILETWSGDDGPARAKKLASSLAWQERQARFDDAMSLLATGDVEQAWIEALPERWKQIAEARMLLWQHADGSFTQRKEPMS